MAYTHDGIVYYARGKNKIKQHYGMEDFFRYYKKKHGDTKTKRGVYAKVMRDIFKGLVHKMIYEGLRLDMPAGLGVIGIAKTKFVPKLDRDGNLMINKLQVDNHKTIELWKRDEEARIARKRVFFVNKHSDGYVYRFRWDKTFCSLKNYGVYSFVTPYYHQRALAAAIKNPNVHIDCIKYGVNK